MEEDLKPPVAQESNDQLPSDADTTAAPSDESDSSPAAGSTRQRNTLARLGRDLASERQRREAAEGQVVQMSETVTQLNARLQALEGHVNERQSAEREAYLDSLAPEDRALEEIKYLKARIASYEQPRPISGEENFRRESVRLLNLANQTYGLGGDSAITYQDLPRSALRTPEAFTAALELIGTQRQALAARDYSSEDDSNMPAAKKGAPPETEEEMEERITNKVLQSIGAGRSNAPRPAAAGKASAPTEEDYVNTTFAYDSKKGPGAMRKQLQEQKDRAREAADARR